MLHRAGAWIRVDDLVGAVVGPEGGREALSAKHMGVRFHRKLHCFVMKVGNGSSANAAGHHAQRRVLHQLETMKGRRREVGGPDRRRVI